MIADPYKKKESLCNSLLRSAFNIDALSVDIIFSSCDSIQIGFSADFNGNYLSVQNGGISLNTPSFYSPGIPSEDCEYPGPRYGYGLDQRDEWTVPPEFENLEAHDYSSDIFTVSWRKNDVVVTRISKNNFVQADNDSRSHYCQSNHEKGVSNNATLWHK
jgi:hypothetical protein